MSFLDIKLTTIFSVASIFLFSCTLFRAVSGVYEFSEDAPIGSRLDVSDEFPVLSASRDSVTLIPSSDGVEFSTWFTVSVESREEGGGGDARIILTTISLLDRETLCPANTPGRGSSDCILNMAALIPSTSTTLEFQVLVSDVNDNVPRFADGRMTLYVSESADVLSTLDLPVAMDADQPSNGVVGYHLYDVTDYAARATTASEEAASKRSRPTPSTNARNSHLNLTDSSPFRLVDAAGDAVPMLQIASPLDRELRSSYALLLTCLDAGGLTSAPLAIDVKVTDVDDNSPRFRSTRQPDIRLSEDLAPGSRVAEVTAYDVDLEAVIAYALVSTVAGEVNQVGGSSKTGGEATSTEGGASSASSPPSIQDLFSVHGTTGVVTLLKQLDHEIHPVYTLTIQAYSGPSAPEVPEAESLTRLVVYVTDVNDNTPTLRLYPVQDYRIGEQEGPDRAVAVVVVDDKDSGVYGEIECEIQPENSDFRLKPIQQKSQNNRAKAGTSRRYLVVPRRPLDADFKKQQTISITCKDGGGLVSGSKYLTPEILDANDNKPTFTQDNYHVTTLENRVPGSSLVTLQAVDNDVTAANRGITYEMLNNKLVDSGDGFEVDERGAIVHISGLPGRDSIFHLDHLTGELFLLKPLDREFTPSLGFTVVAKDSGTPSLTSRVEVKVTVEDENDNPPRFLFPEGSEVLNADSRSGYQTAYVTLVLVGDESLSSVFTLRTRDPDLNDTVHFRLLGHAPSTGSPAFRLDSATGELYPAAGGWSLQGIQTRVNLTVSATDKAGNTANATLMVLVQPAAHGEGSNSGGEGNFPLAVGLGVLGALLVLTAAVVLAIWWRRRGKRKRQKDGQVKSDDSQPGLNNFRVEFADFTEREDYTDCRMHENPLHSTPKDKLSMDSGNGQSQVIDMSRTETEVEPVYTKPTTPAQHEYISTELGELASQAFRLGKQRMARRTPQLDARHTSNLQSDTTELNGEHIYIDSLQSRV